MAGIEKVCEFSGDYYSYDMYSYKRNHIQIHPMYRKRFSGAGHTLHVNSIRPVLHHKRHDWYRTFAIDILSNYEPPFHTVREYNEYASYFENEKLIAEVDFTLEVFDPELAGEVSGRYNNLTLDFNSTKRRIKRMLKCRELNIVSHLDDGKSVGEFWCGLLKQIYIPEA